MKPLRTLLPLFILLIGCTEPEAPAYPDAYEPEEALALFQLRAGFHIELFAAEPHVQDPVELVFDENGRAIVVEMPDYPYKPAPGEGKSRVKYLEDTDGDGRIDKNTVFAQGLSEATSALPWRGGLIVTAAPSIYHIKDIDGDDRGDEVETLFTGFFENNSEAQITNLRFNVDNWIYASNFGQPGTVTSSRDPDAPPLNMRGGDFRFRLDDHAFELAAGPTQFGQAVDDWGHRFATHNTQHISQLVIPWRYLHRHEHLDDSRILLNISDHELRMYQLSPTPYWRDERTRRRQKRYDDEGYGRIEYARDHFTGSSGGTVYDGDLFGEAFYGNVFTGDVAGNLVHRDILITEPGSPVFTARRADDEQDREFLATTDNWFRPASVTVGPDGALYVIDMYRQHIETPLSIPEDLKRDMDFYAGEDRGRIYRIVPEAAGDLERSGALPGEADEAGLIAMLASPNGWVRRTVHRLLVEEPHPEFAEAVRLVASSALPQARLHALYVLDAWGVLQNADIRKAMADEQPEIRLHGIRLAETCLVCRPDITRLAEDVDARIVLQAALSMGQFNDQEALRAMAGIAVRFAGDPWMQKALLSSEKGSSMEMVEMLAGSGYFSVDDSTRRAFLQELAGVIGRRNASAEISNLVEFLTGHEPIQQEAWQVAVFTGLRDGLESLEEPPAIDGVALEVLEEWKVGKPTRVVELVDGLTN